MHTCTNLAGTKSPSAQRLQACSSFRCNGSVELLTSMNVVVELAISVFIFVYFIAVAYVVDLSLLIIRVSSSLGNRADR
jgi:hypothetical protein